MKKKTPNWHNVVQEIISQYFQITTVGSFNFFFTGDRRLLLCTPIFDLPNHHCLYTVEFL